LVLLKTTAGLLVGGAIAITTVQFGLNRGIEVDVVAPAPPAEPGADAPRPPPAPRRERASRPVDESEAPEQVVAPDPPVRRAEPGLAAPVEPPAEGDDPAEQPGSTLAGEIAALDRARKALARRDADAVLVALDEHDRGRPSGALATEAMVLRIEALLLRGDRVWAARLARRFLDAHPNSPHGDRLREIVGGESSER
jgi:hypothetical protein